MSLKFKFDKFLTPKYSTRKKLYKGKYPYTILIKGFAIYSRAGTKHCGWTSVHDSHICSLYQLVKFFKEHEKYRDPNKYNVTMFHGIWESMLDIIGGPEYVTNFDLDKMRIKHRHHLNQGMLRYETKEEMVSDLRVIEYLIDCINQQNDRFRYSLSGCLEIVTMDPSVDIEFEKKIVMENEKQRSEQNFMKIRKTSDFCPLYGYDYCTSITLRKTENDRRDSIYQDIVDNMTDTESTVDVQPTYKRLIGHWSRCKANIIVKIYHNDPDELMFLSLYMDNDVYVTSTKHYVSKENK